MYTVVAHKPMRYPSSAMFTLGFSLRTVTTYFRPIYQRAMAVSCPSQSVLLDNHGNKPQSGPTSVVRTITPYYLHCYRRNYLVFPVDFRPLLLSGTPDTPSNIAWTLPAKFSTQTQLSAELLVLHKLCQTPSQCGIYPAKRKRQMFEQHMYRF